MNKRSSITALLTGLMLTLTPAVAHAHQLGLDYDPNRSVPEYLWLGFLHMVTGYDHLLFIAGILLLAGNLRTAVKLISLFVAGHSLTLLVASIVGWKLNATVVDVIIALSVVFVGVIGLRRPALDLRWFATAVFGFGLIHGLGLSTRLQDLGLPDDGIVIRVILFNVGVEIGQIVALVIFVGIGRLLARRLRRQPSAQRAAFASLVVAGLLAAVILSFPSGDSESEPKPIADEQAQTSACTETDEQAAPGLAGGHPPKAFFGPDEPAPEDDLAHVVGDGYVIVRYDPELPAEQVEELQIWVERDGGSFTVAAPDPEQDVPVRAITALKTLSCERFDLDGMTGFRDRWLEFVRSRTGG